MSNDFIAHVARQLAEAEAAHQQAQEAHAVPAEEVQILRERVQAAQQRIAELRALAVDRELSDKEAASLNLALLDLTDLGGLLSAAEVQCRQAMALVMERAAVVLRLQGDLRQATERAKVEALKVAAREAEQYLVAVLQQLWQAGSAAQHGVRFIALWAPSNELRRAAVHHQPPMSGFSG